ncbi:MAG: carbohydrate ABC transporter permease [Clostridia bacterium]|nr:carbohydrate ABC transporter permease [Clostridia bacterium]
MKPYNKNNRIRKDKSVFIITGVILFLHMTSLVLPFIWMLLTSVKGLLDYQESFLGWPKTFHWENYTRIFDLLSIEVVKDGNTYIYYIWNLLQNSLMLSIFSPLFSLLPVVLTSYVVSKFTFVGKQTLRNINIFVMIIPLVGNLANTLLVYRKLGLYNNFWPFIIFPHQPFGFNFLLLYGVFKAIPDSYSEAVQIDGGGHMTVFLRIMLPMVVPTLVTLYVLGFISSWNDYSTPLVYLRSVPNLAYGLYEFQYNSSKYGAILPEILAGFVICSIPSVVLFISFQKVITRSLMIGGIKE